MKVSQKSLFEKLLSVQAEEIEFELHGHHPVAWCEFWLNPRRLRGSDFLMRWSQGHWSEERLIEAVNNTSRFFAVPYGPSGVAPDDVREFELYFERLDAAGLGNAKRPDLLVFKKSDQSKVKEAIAELGGLTELPFSSEEAPPMKLLLSHAVIAVECENSLWIAKKMPDYGTTLTPQKRLGGRNGLKKTAVVPTIIIKDEDIEALSSWQKRAGVPRGGSGKLDSGDKWNRCLKMA
ncbi:MAG: AccI family restriction endonuclease [Chloroflexi bacterium]|nr:AccI family restriction endonuclease [Chloroflexota bacterium]